MFCSWDGEEVTLTGSTEWGEQFASELQQKAVAYLNVDSAASGPRLDLSAVGSLAPMVVELTEGAARSVGRVALRRLADARTTRPSGPTDGTLPDQALVDTKIGSGSDHTVFINHVGAAGRRDGLRRTVRRLPLGLRQPLLGEDDRRSRASVSRS